MMDRICLMDCFSGIKPSSYYCLSNETSLGHISWMVSKSMTDIEIFFVFYIHRLFKSFSYVSCGKKNIFTHILFWFNFFGTLISNLLHSITSMVRRIKHIISKNVWGSDDFGLFTIKMLSFPFSISILTLFQFSKKIK